MFISTDCPEEGVWLQQECFAYYEQNVNWTTARENCQQLGGDLAVPNNVKSFLTWLSTWEKFKKDTSTVLVLILIYKFINKMIKMFQ